MAKAGRSGVESADVEAAIAELVAEDRRPTLRAVREHLGRGSLGTIQRHLADLQGRADSKLVAEALPDSVTKAILAFARERITGVEAQLAQKGANAEEAIRTLVEANDQMTIDLEAEKVRCTEIQTQCDVRSGRIAELEESLRTAREELRREASARESAEVQIARMEVQLERLPQAEATLDGLQSRIRENEAVIGEARMSRATATAELAASKELSEHYRSRMDALQADLSRTVAATDELIRQLKSLEAENSKLTAMLEKRLGEGAPRKAPTTEPGATHTSAA